MTNSISKKIDTEIAKLIAENSKLNRQTFWYPMALSAGLILAVGSVIKFVL